MFIKKILSTILSLAIAGGYVVNSCKVVPDMNVYSMEKNDIIAFGTYGESIKWEINNFGTLTIKGTGAMTDYKSSSDVPWNTIKQNVNEIVIEEGITNIGDFAFCNFRNLQMVRIPDTVTKIGNCAFSSCVNLPSIDIPNKVSEIGFSAFSECESLNSIDFPDLVEILGNNAFNGCTNLTSVYLGKSLHEIDVYTFSRCSNLQSITIPNSVTSIRSGAFYDCINLHSVELGDKVTNIGEKAFYGCTQLKTIDFSAFISSIQESTFYNCTNLKSITLPESVKSIGKTAFYGCTSLNSITVCNRDCYIESSQDTICNIESDGECLYAGVIKGYLNSSAEMYADVYGREFVAIDEQETTIISSGECGDEGDNLTWTLDSEGTLTITGKGAVADYEYKQQPWSNLNLSIKKVSIEHGVTRIGNNAFSSCGNINMLNIAETVESIGASSFKDCFRLTNVSLPKSVKTIEDEAFWCCYGMSSIDFSDSLESIGEEAFCDCTKLASIVIPASVKTIHSGAFYRCSSLESIHILNPDCIIEGGSSTICDSQSSDKWYYSGKIYGYKSSTAEEYARKYDRTFVDIDEQEPTIISSGECGDEGGNLIWTLDSDGTLNISGIGRMKDYKIVTSYVDGEYDPPPWFDFWTEYESRVTNIVLGEGITHIGDYAFMNSPITELKMPNTITSIGKGAFGYANSSNSKLKKIQFSDELTEIGEAAFSNSHQLTSVNLPENIAYIGDLAFSNNTNLELVTIKNKQCTIINDPFVKSSPAINDGSLLKEVIVKGYNNSTAEEFANKYGYSFISLDNYIETSTSIISTSTAVSITTTTTTTTESTTTTTTTESTTTTTTTESTTTTTKTESTTTTTTLVNVCINKVDIGGKELEGATLKLTGVKSDGTTAIEFKEDSIQVGEGGKLENGVGNSLVWISGTKVTIIFAEDGTYTLHEEAAPKGYIVADDITFIVKNGIITINGNAVDGIDMVNNEETITTTETTTTTTELTTTPTTQATTTETTITTAYSTTELVPSLTTIAFEFNREKDSWNIDNHEKNFCNSNGRIILQNEMELIEKIKNKYERRSLNSTIDKYLTTYAGSCYGMTLLDMVYLSDRDYYLPLIQEEAKDLRSVEVNEDVISKINYYSILQLLPDVKYEMAMDRCYYESETGRINKLLNLLENGPVLLCYKVNKDAKGEEQFAHAVIAYDVETYYPEDGEDTEFFDNLGYQSGTDTLKMVKVYDPNYKNYSEDCNIFINTINAGTSNEKKVWGIKDHFAYNKLITDKELILISQDMDKLNRYGLFDTSSGFFDNDSPEVLPELIIISKSGKKYCVDLSKDDDIWIGGPSDECPYFSVPNTLINGEVEVDEADDYILKYNDKEYIISYEDNGAYDTSLKIKNTSIFDLDADIFRRAKFSNDSITFELGKGSHFKLEATYDIPSNNKNDVYNIEIEGNASDQIICTCTYSNGIWWIESSSPLHSLTINAQNDQGNTLYTNNYTANGNRFKILYNYDPSAKKKGIIVEDLQQASITFDLGDVNSDKKIDAKDASVILIAYAKASTGESDGLTDDQRSAADANGDNKIDAKDASVILAYYSLVSTSTGDVETLKEYTTLR